MRWQSASLIFCIWLPACVLSARGAEEPSAEQETYFEQKVRPIFVEHCWECHGEKKQEAGLRLDSRDAILRGGDSGPAVVEGQPDESLLMRAVNYDGDTQMPPKGKLPDEEIAALRNWIAAGAVFPEKLGAATGPALGAMATPEGIAQSKATHWSYQPIRRSTPPAAPDANWCRDPIDRFIAARLEAAGLPPSPSADRRTLLRRATFDLIGLPPTMDEVAEFEADPRRMRSNAPSIGCWPRPITANAGAATGSTSRVTPTPKATSSPRSGGIRSLTRTAITSSRRSTTIGRSTAS